MCSPVDVLQPLLQGCLCTNAEGNAFPKEGHRNKFSFPKKRVHVNFRASQRQVSGNLVLVTEFSLGSLVICQDTDSDYSLLRVHSCGPFSLVFGRH
jgi:hypothetical protein